MISLIAHYTKSPLARYVIAVIIVWGLIFAIGYWRRGVTPGHPLLHVFAGFMLGMLAMYIATRVYRPGRDDANTAAHG